MSFWGGIAQAVGIAAGSSYGPIGAQIGLSAANFAIDKFTPQPKTTSTGAFRPVSRPRPQTNASKFGQMLAQNAGGLYQAYQSNKVTKNAANSVLQGGIMDRDQRNLELSMQDPAYIRQQFEAAGFNPLLGIGNALKGLGYGPTMGQNMANAASIQADGFHKSQLLEVQRTELDMENRRLNAQIQNMSLNRNVGGVYSRSRSILGGSNAIKGASLAIDGASSNDLEESRSAKASNPYYRGDNSFVDPRMPDAEATEQRYGDVQQELFGTNTLLSDTLHNKKMQKIVKQYGITVAEAVQQDYASSIYLSFDDVVQRQTRGFSTRRRPLSIPSSKSNIKTGKHIPMSFGPNKRPLSIDIAN